MNPETRTPPLLPTPRSNLPPRRRILIVIGVVAVIGILALLAVFTVFQATRKDTVEDYRLLCGCLMGNLPADGVTEAQPTEAEIQALLPLAYQELARISRRARRLAPIARDFSELIRQAEMLQQNAPQLSPILFGSAQAALGLYAGQRASVNEGGQKALKATENLWNAFVTFQKMLEKRQVMAVQLADLANQFSGAESSSPVLQCSFAQHKPGFFELQTRERLVITNSSGRALNNCVVAVRFSDSAGKSCLNIYSVPRWPAAEQRAVGYSTFDFPKTTVDDINRVDVRLWSTECLMPTITLKRPRSGWQDF